MSNRRRARKYQPRPAEAGKGRAGSRCRQGRRAAPGHQPHRARPHEAQGKACRAFTVTAPPPGVVPVGASPSIAMDSGISAVNGWAAGYYNGNWAFSEGLEFLGYPYLAELAQRPEYRRIVEVIATEMTRNGSRLFHQRRGRQDDRIKAINEEMERLEVQSKFKTLAETGWLLWSRHLYLDTGDTDDLVELVNRYRDGRNKTSKSKVKKGSLQHLQNVEAVWTYPTNYNSSDPLKQDWYKPDLWYVMGKRIHGSRLLTVIGREVPDLLKPAYSFGGPRAYADGQALRRQLATNAPVGQ